MKLIITSVDQKEVELTMTTPDVVSIPYSETFSPAQFRFFNDLFTAAFGFFPMWVGTDEGIELHFSPDMHDVFARDRSRAISCIPWLMLLNVVRPEDEVYNSSFELNTPSMGFSGWVFDAACEDFGRLPALRFEPMLGVTVGVSWDGEEYRYRVRKHKTDAGAGWLPENIEELFVDGPPLTTMMGSTMGFAPRGLRGAILAAWKLDLPFPPKAVLDVLRRSA